MDTYLTFKRRTIAETDEWSGTYTAQGWAGVAWSVLGYEVEADEDTEWSGTYNRTGNLLAAMVGDDKPFVFFPADLAPLPEDAFCRGCGQIGCTAERMTR